MADHYALSLPRLGEVTRALALAPQVVMDELDRFFAIVLPHMTSEIVDRTPASQGHLRSSIIGNATVNESGFLGVVGTSLNYATPVELGSRPHPVSEEGILQLAEWAKRTLPLGQAVSLKTGRPLKTKGIEEAALSAAHAIAWKIRTKGSKGAFMFRDAFIANRGQVIYQFEQAVDRIVKRIGGMA